MLEILDTKWDRGEKGLKALLLELSINNTKYSLRIESHQDIDLFIENLVLNTSQTKEIKEALSETFKFNQEECKKTLSINKQVKEMIAKHSN